MRYRIHFEWPNGTEDSIIVAGETISEIIEVAEEEIQSRNGSNTWSEKLS